MSRYAILTFEENDTNDGSLVLARFGKYVVIDQSRYDNAQTDDWHLDRANEYLRWLEMNEPQQPEATLPEHKEVR